VPKSALVLTFYRTQTTFSFMIWRLTCSTNPWPHALRCLHSITFFMNCHLTTDTKPNRRENPKFASLPKAPGTSRVPKPYPPQRLLNLYTDEYAAEMCWRNSV
jgi:hypothetical protein